MHTLKEKLIYLRHEKGIKYNWIAKQVNIERTLISKHVKDVQNLSKENEEKLEKFIKECFLLE